MDKELQDNYQLDFTQQTQILRRKQQQEEGSTENGVEMVDYMLGNCNHPSPQHHLSFADVMHFADFGPKLALNQANKTHSDDDSYFFKFNFMTDHNKIQEGPSSLPPPPPPPQLLEDGEEEEEEEGGQFSENASSVQQQQQQQHLGFGCGGGGDQSEKTGGGDGVEVKNRRKRPRSMKTSEEVESQRMTHIAVERNRRRQMNEHLHVLRSLMPGSYFQRGDQASIIGGAIEFVRELEQLLQCLESQKRRRLLGGAEPPPSRNMADAPPLPLPIQEAQQQQRQQPPFFPPLPLPFNGGDNNMRMLDLDTSSNIHEDMAENKSCLADIQVRVLGFDAMIKILSRRSSGQLIKTIAALEDLQFNILQTNITTIEQTVLYSFNVKIAGEASCTAEDIANSVQQILCFTDTSTM